MNAGNKLIKAGNHPHKSAGPPSDIYPKVSYFNKAGNKL
jgi:hypothetical protein